MNRPVARLYVNALMTPSELTARVAEALGGVVGRGGFATAALEGDVRRGADHEPATVAMDPQDYIRYPYAVEVEGRDGVELNRYVEGVGQVMRVLERLGASVVAACDWEDELPGAGKLGPAFAVRGSAGDG